MPLRLRAPFVLEARPEADSWCKVAFRVMALRGVIRRYAGTLMLDKQRNLRPTTHDATPENAPYCGESLEGTSSVPEGGR